MRNTLKAMAPAKLVVVLHKPDGCDVLGDILKEATDCDIVSLSDAHMFDRIIRNCRPDLIVLDLAFGPELTGAMAGNQAGGLFAQLNSRNRVPAIGITRRELPEPPPEIRERMESILTLPFHREQFLEAAVHWLRAPAARS